uniref:hypothetical protein n=1 Tax=Klebsiella pneumoniae TaxID=573 RepID=UPI003B986B28
DYGGEFICDGEVKTDMNGDAEVEFNSSPISLEDVTADRYGSVYQDRKYKIQAEVTDLSRITVEGSTSEIATAGDFELFVTPDSWVAAVGQPLGVTVKAIDFDGKPVVNQKIALQVARLLHDRENYTVRGTQTVADLIAMTGS